MRNDNEIVIDGKGASFLAFNNRACDLLLEDLNLSGRGILQVKNIKNPEVITVSVSRCSKEGYGLWLGGLIKMETHLLRSKTLMSWPLIFTK